MPASRLAPLAACAAALLAASCAPQPSGTPWANVREATPAPGSPGPAAPGVGPATVTAIEERLGLRLEPQIGPVDYLVIDRVERSTEDR